jgi:excisionase family DNA binding protein
MQTPSADAKPARRKPERSSREPLTYTLSDAATVSGLSKSTLYRRAAEGRLHMVRVGGRRLVSAASLRALVGVDA